MTIRNIILFLFLFLGLISAPAQESKLDDLKSWVGKYPTDKKRDFFQLTKIQKPLKALLSRSDFRHLTKELTVETPIESIKHYLIIKVCREHCAPCDNAMLVVNLEDGTLFVGFYKFKKGGSIIRWFSSKDVDDYYELPKEILDEFLYMHEAKQ